MRLFAKIVKIHPNLSMSEWPYRGYIYNEQGILLNSVAVGMTEEECKKWINREAALIRSLAFRNDPTIFEV